MKTERAAALVRRWVRFYTQELPAPVAERRIDEIGADLHDHIAHDRDRGTSDGRIALSILARMVRGLIADVSWRRRVRPLRGDIMRSFAGILVVTLAVAAVGVVAILVGQEDDAPGLVLIGILLIVVAFALGVRTGLRSGRSGP